MESIPPVVESIPLGANILSRKLCCQGDSVGTKLLILLDPAPRAPGLKRLAESTAARTQAPFPLGKGLERKTCAFRLKGVTKSPWLRWTTSRQACMHSSRGSGAGHAWLIHLHLPVPFHVDKSLHDAAWPADLDALGDRTCPQPEVHPWITGG